MLADEFSTEAIILSQPNTENKQFWTKTTVINYCSLMCIF